MSQKPPRNKLIITYHKGQRVKSHPEKGYVVRKASKHNEKGTQPVRHGKGGGALPHDYDYGKVKSQRCKSLEEAMAVELFENAVKKAIYWDENREPHELKIRPVQTFKAKFLETKDE